MECLLPYLCMVTVPHIMVGLERMLDYRVVGLERFHCIHLCTQSVMSANLWCHGPDGQHDPGCMFVQLPVSRW